MMVLTARQRDIHKRFERAVGRAWFLWAKEKRRMESNRRHHPRLWITFLRYMREDRDAAL
jgi:hypothetical protein